MNVPGDLTTALPDLRDLIGDRDYLVDETLTGALAAGETITGVEFDGCTFTGCTAAEASFVRCTFTDCRFVGCDLSMLTLTDSRLVGGAFERCKMLGISFAALVSPLAVEPIRFKDCRLDFASFRGVELPEATWQGCGLREADFGEAVLTGAAFPDSDLSMATFTGTDLRDASLVGARGYAFDVRENRVRGLRVDADEGARLLEVLGLHVE